MSRNTVLKYIRYGPDGNSVAEAFCLGVGALPGRKQQAIYLCESDRIIPIAYFKDENHAKVAANLLDNILRHRGHVS